MVATAGVLFVCIGEPLLAERAERASLAPLVALAMALALLPALRTRRAVGVIGGLAGFATVMAGVVHYATTAAVGWAFRPVEVAWTAAFYFGAVIAVAAVFAIARRLGGLGLAVPIAMVFALGYVPGKVMVHRPKRVAGRDPAQVGPSEPVELRTSDGYRLTGTFFPAATGGRRPAVIIQHGIMAEHSVCFPSWAKLVHGLGYAALLFDWRGHGRSDGHVVTFGAREVEDVRAAVAWLRARPDVDPERIAFVGESMGAAIGIVATAELPEIRAICADASYDDLRETAAHRMRFWVLPAIAGRAMAEASLACGRLETGIDYARVSPVARIAEIAPRPVLIVHGDADRATPPACSQHLFDAAREPRELVFFKGAGHIRRPQEIFAPEFRDRFARFLEAAFH